MLGANGVEPEFLEGFRAQAKEHAPFFYNNIVKDSMMRKYMENPFAVRRWLPLPVSCRVVSSSRRGAMD